MSEPDDKSLHDLILGYLDGRLSTSEFGELQNQLKSDPGALAEFSSLARLDSGLRDVGWVSPGQSGRVTKSPYLGWALAAALVMLAVVTGILFTREEVSTDFASDPTRGVAVVSVDAGAVWEGQEVGREIRQGVALEPGRLALKSGLAQIDFYGGASISLSGPADLELISGKAAVLYRGRIKADVPPAARGFEIRTGEVVIEDLGTSFGLVADGKNRTDLVVFDGEVRALNEGKKPVSYYGGDAVLLKNGEAISQSVEEVGSFPDIADVIAGAGSLDENRYEKWRAASLERRADTRLIAYYDFEGLTDLSRRLPNRATESSGPELDGGIVGAQVATGRWSSKTALDFRREGDRVRFQIPGEFENLTLYAWVRIDALDRHLSSLFLTDYYDPEEFHWQISGVGKLHFASSPFGVEDLERNNRRFYSEAFWNPEMSGQWFHLATTVKTQSQEVIHYINGESIGMSGGTNRKKPLRKFRIGGADLGNWTEPIWPKAQLRTLNGRIDEFALYDAALSAEEIRAIYEVGKP